MVGPCAVGTNRYGSTRNAQARGTRARWRACLPNLEGNLDAELLISHVARRCSVREVMTQWRRWRETVLRITDGRSNLTTLARYSGVYRVNFRIRVAVTGVWCDVA